MILTDYYRFERLVSKAKFRMDCTFSTKTYPEFEEKRATKSIRESEKKDAINVGDLIIYYHNVPSQFGGSVHRKADKSISIKGKNLSSVYVPDCNSNYAYGDVRGTSDALLFVFNNLSPVNGVINQGAVIEIFVARGYCKNRLALYNAFCDGELDEDIEYLKQRASLTTENDK